MSQKEREQLQAELSILKELRHPNIVAYFERDHIKASQDLHLYMEYCGNGDLGRVIRDLKNKNQVCEEEYVWSIFSQIVSALYRCHYGEDPPAAGRNVMGLVGNAKPVRDPRKPMILHRDLKPENSQYLVLLLSLDCTNNPQSFSETTTVSSWATSVCPRSSNRTISPLPTLVLLSTCRPRFARRSNMDPIPTFGHSVASYTRCAPSHLPSFSRAPKSHRQLPQHNTRSQARHCRPSQLAHCQAHAQRAGSRQAGTRSPRATYAHSEAREGSKRGHFTYP